MSDPNDAPKFDPNATHPKVDMTREINKELSKVEHKLREAGVTLAGLKWKMVASYWNPVGFDFTTDDWKRLQDAADKSTNLGMHQIDMPGYDPWAKAGIKSVGFTRIGAPPYVHLDIAIDRPGLCRVYIIPRGPVLTRDALARAAAARLEKNGVYRKIAHRLATFDPPILLDDHIGSKLEARKTILDGINFVANDHQALLQALRDAKDSGRKPAFAEGFKEDFKHLPLSLSYLATDGTGFREIWRPHLSHRPLNMPEARSGPSPDPDFGSLFGPSFNSQDVSSLHCAVSPRGCNIHIDEIGFVMEDGDGNLIVNPNALAHILNELVVKTNLRGKLPNWALDRFNFHVASSPLQFSGWGASFDVVQRKNVRVTIRGSCRFLGGFSHAETVNLGWRF